MSQPTNASYQPRGKPRGPGRSNNNFRPPQRSNNSSSNNNDRNEGNSNNSSWQRSYQNRSSNRPRNTNTHNSNNNRDSNKKYNNTDRRGGGTSTASLTFSGARTAALKHLEAGNYRGAAKILVDAARTGVLTQKKDDDDDDDAQLNLLEMLHTMIKRNLYPEVTSIIKIVWNTDDDKKNGEIRKKILSAFPPKELVMLLIHAQYHEEACRCLTEFKLKTDTDLTTFALDELLRAGQFDRALKLSKSLDYPIGYQPQTMIQIMIDRGNISVALKVINELKNLVVQSSSGGNECGKVRP